MEQIECIFRMTLDNMATAYESDYRPNPSNFLPFNEEEERMITILNGHDVWEHNGNN